MSDNINIYSTDRETQLQTDITFYIYVAHNYAWYSLIPQLCRKLLNNFGYFEWNFRSMRFVDKKSIWFGVNMKI